MVERCTLFKPDAMHGEHDDRLCSACHRPSQEWEYFPSENSPNIIQCLYRADKRGVPLPGEVLPYSYDSDDESGSNACGVHPRQLWGTGVGCSVATSGNGTQGRTTIVRAIRTKKRSWRRVQQMVEGLLQEFDR